MLNTVHAGGEQGWESGHLEPFFVLSIRFAQSHPNNPKMARRHPREVPTVAHLCMSRKGARTAKKISPGFFVLSCSADFAPLRETFFFASPPTSVQSHPNNPKIARRHPREVPTVPHLCMSRKGSRTAKKISLEFFCSFLLSGLCVFARHGLFFARPAYFAPSAPIFHQTGNSSDQYLTRCSGAFGMTTRASTRTGVPGAQSARTVSSEYFTEAPVWS